MPPYKCEKCSYQTSNKTSFESHLNRKIPCNPNKPNKNRKDTVEFSCKICDQVFSQLGSLNRHNRTFHVTNKNKNKNKNKNNNSNGNNNQLGGTKNTQNNTKIHTQINNNNNSVINITIPIIYDYTYNDINDLTLFEQYQALTSKKSPYSGLLDHLNLNPDKPKYQNIHLGSIHKNTMDVHNGQEWIKEMVSSALDQIVDTKKIMLRIIFNRFRCFLSKKATDTIRNAFYYGYQQENSYFHKKLVQNIKIHLYNKRNNKNPPNTDIPDDRENEIWWALSKRFTWKEVTKFIIKMDKLEIDFDKNLNEIKTQILDCISDKPERKQFFHKLLKQLDSVINDFETNDDTLESSDDNL